MLIWCRVEISLQDAGDNERVQESSKIHLLCAHHNTVTLKIEGFPSLSVFKLFSVLLNVASAIILEIHTIGNEKRCGLSREF